LAHQCDACVQGNEDNPVTAHVCPSLIEHFSYGGCRLSFDVLILRQVLLIGFIFRRVSVVPFILRQSQDERNYEVQSPPRIRYGNERFLRFRGVAYKIFTGEFYGIDDYEQI